jgi:Flp pilus assembly CpaF family ATPase
LLFGGRLKVRECTWLSSRKGSNGSIVITTRLISDHLIFILAVHSLASPAMSTAKEEAASSSDALPFRQGARRAEEFRAECPRFRILIIGKANAGKTTILRKVCNAKPDAKPIIYDEKGKEVKVRPGNLAIMAKTNQNLGWS